jgi:hypothetical protein
MIFIDSAILNVTEWLCRRVQLLTGRTNVWLAFQLTNLSIVVYFVWAAMSVWVSPHPAVRTGITLFCGALFWVLTLTILRVPIETHESSAYRRVAKGFGNPRRVRDQLLRIPFLTLSIVLLYPSIFLYVNMRMTIVLLAYSLVVLTTLVLYLLACDPLPPCPGRVREWLKAVRPSRIGEAESLARD